LLGYTPIIASGLSGPIECPLDSLEAYQHLYGGKAHRQTPPNHPNMPKHPLNQHSPSNITIYKKMSKQRI
jgi:hypothetical protein